ncbi:MAG: hypothetical protein GX596_02975 [Propionibacterium sp.]|nr:hypothetical protein [Propionibacterium sp.]
MSDQPAAKPPVPTPVTIIVVLVAVLLVAGAFLLGRWLADDGPSAPPEEPAAPLVAPESIGEFQVSETSAPSTAADVGKDVVRATYTDGTNRVLLVLSRPEADLEEFLTNAGIQELQAAPEADDASPEPSAATVCGRSADTEYAACGRQIEETGQLLVALTDVDPNTLTTLLQQLPS